MNTSNIDKEATKHEYSEILHVSITTNLDIMSFSQICLSYASKCIYGRLTKTTLLLGSWIVKFKT